mmetsp:Transcript_15321/g.46284  ORF Transcript_15321/g.46284 Transcript_15321/m.46284 type:complete len:234 (+) Transcript_15321:193-894(+)
MTIVAARASDLCVPASAAPLPPAALQPASEQLQHSVRALPALTTTMTHRAMAPVAISLIWGWQRFCMRRRGMGPGSRQQKPSSSCRHSTCRCRGHCSRRSHHPAPCSGSRRLLRRRTCPACPAPSSRLRRRQLPDQTPTSGQCCPISQGTGSNRCRGCGAGSTGPSSPMLRSTPIRWRWRAGRRWTSEPCTTSCKPASETHRGRRFSCGRGTLPPSSSCSPTRWLFWMSCRHL